MIRSNKVYFSIIGLVCIVFISSCDSAIPGCTDQNAENYNFEADEDDGTCSFRGSAVFYHEEATSQNLLSAGVTNVKLYVDDQFWDAMSPNVFFTFVPNCGNEDAMNMSNYGIGNSPSQAFTYKIKDQDENILDAGSFMISGNECNAIAYEY